MYHSAVHAEGRAFAKIPKHEHSFDLFAGMKTAKNYLSGSNPCSLLSFKQSESTPCSLSTALRFGDLLAHGSPLVVHNISLLPHFVALAAHYRRGMPY
jgi:hypothetical protein